MVINKSNKTKPDSVKRKTKKYSGEFKRKIVEEYMAGGISASELHRKYGPSQKSVSNWIIAAKAGKSTIPKKQKTNHQGYVEVKIPNAEKLEPPQSLSFFFKNGTELKFNTKVSASYISSIVTELGY